MGQSRMTLTELPEIKRKSTESVDQYLNRFRLLKARCFTQAPEQELVEMAAKGLDYSVQKKLTDIQSVRDMPQLAARVRQIEKLKAEKILLTKRSQEKSLRLMSLNFSLGLRINVGR